MVTALHSSALFQLLDSRCRSPRTGPSASRGGEPPHLALLRRGAFAYHVGSRRYIGDGCTALLHREPVEYRISHPTDDGDDATLIVPAPRLFEELWPERRAGPPELKLSVAARVLHAAAIVAARRRDALACDERLLALLAAVREGADRAEERSGRPATRRRLVGRVRALLAATLSDNVELDRLAREVECSPFHLMRLFKAETGHTLRSYRRRLRVFAAIERLQDPEVDLAALAVELGFAHHSHFTAAFHQVVGVPPKTVRAQLAPRSRPARRFVTAAPAARP